MTHAKEPSITSKATIRSSNFKGTYTWQASLTLHYSKGAFTQGTICQVNLEGRERPLYYLSRTLIGAKLNYSPIEKMCLALMFSIQKLRHYMQAHTMNVIFKAIKYILPRPVLYG